MSFLFTSFFVVAWLLHGYLLTLPAVLALLAGLVLDFAPLPDARGRWRARL